MKVHLERLDGAFHFVGRNEAGVETHFDLTEEEGGTNQAPGPMQTVAMALASCSSIDVVLILNKQRQVIESFEIEVDYDRASDQVPAVFTRLHMDFILTGDLEPGKVQRAIDLSVSKYCSVSAMLSKTARITASCVVNGKRYE